jgi:hypothetical protein
MTTDEFRKQIEEGIPSELPVPKAYDYNLNHAPKRKDFLKNFILSWQKSLQTNWQHTAGFTCTGSNLIMR